MRRQDRISKFDPDVKPRVSNSPVAVEFFTLGASLLNRSFDSLPLTQDDKFWIKLVIFKIGFLRGRDDPLYLALNAVLEFVSRERWGFMGVKSVFFAIFVFFRIFWCFFDESWGVFSKS
jgi:hypothetical protein